MYKAIDARCVRTSSTPIQQITFNSCNSLVIHKETLPTGTPGGPFSYVVDQADGQTVHDGTLGFDAGEPDTDTSLTSISNTLTVPTDTTDTWRNVIGQPDYQITETNLPIDWSYQSLVCSYYDVMTGEYVENRTIGEDDVFAIAPIGDVLNPNPGTECTITNATSALTVVKQGAGGSDTFTFNVTNKDAFGLQLGQSSDPLTFTPGTAVTITETMPTTPSNGLDWVSYGAECRVEGAPATDPPLATVTAGQPINVTTVAGENVICTFINQQQAGLRVTKNIDPDDTDEQFAFTWAGVPGATSDTLGDGASSPVYVVAPNVGLVTGATAPTDPYTVTETNPGGYLTTITCSNAGSTSTGRTATYQVAPGEIANCTFVNSAPGSITIIKNAVPDAAQDFTFTTTAPVAPASPGYVDGTTFILDDDADATRSNTQQFSGLVPGEYTFTEQTTPGWTLSGVTCTTGAATSVDGATVTVNLASDEAVVCTYTNQRNAAQLTLTKDWTNALAGQQVQLSTQGDVNTTTLFGSSRSSGPNVAAVTTPVTRSYYSGETVNLAEVFQVGQASNYNVTLSCATAAGEEVPEDAGSLSYTAGALTGSFTAGANPVAVTCTFVNTAKTANLVLQKSWGTSPVDGEVAALTATGALATGNASHSNDGDATNDQTANIQVVLGETVSLTESVSKLIDGVSVDVAGRFDTQLACDAGTLNYSPGRTNGSVVIDPTTVAEGATVTCTFTNTRHNIEITMLKAWATATRATRRRSGSRASTCRAPRPPIRAIPTVSGSPRCPRSPTRSRLRTTRSTSIPPASSASPATAVKPSPSAMISTRPTRRATTRPGSAATPPTTRC